MTTHRMTTRRAAIVAPVRTPVGTFGGSLRAVPVEDLRRRRGAGRRGRVHEQRRALHHLGPLGRHGRYLLETMCVGGGQGVAAVFEAA